MKVRKDRHPIPEDWSGCPCEGLILDRDVTPIYGRSRLRLKLLIFDTPENLRTAWKEFLGRPEEDVGECMGMVTGLMTEVYNFEEDGREDHYLSVDPKYFAVMGLCEPYLLSEVVCHECVHAGFAYHYRVGGRSPFCLPEWQHEEAVCYPTGHMFRMICHILHDEGYW